MTNVEDMKPSASLKCQEILPEQHLQDETTPEPSISLLVTAPLNTSAQAHPTMDANMLFDDSSATESDLMRKQDHLQCDIRQDI